MKRSEAWLRLVSALLVLFTAACAGSAGGGAQPRTGAGTPASTAPAAAIKVVAIGDSDATGIGDASGRGWVGRYASLLQQKLATEVAADNKAAEGETSNQLRSDVASDDALRRALAGADVILIGIGGADLNAGDDALSAGRCQGRACYAQILARFGQNMSAATVQVRRLAPRALVRAMSIPDAFPGGGTALPPFANADLSRYQVTTEHALVCRAVQANGGRCVDVPGAFNGPAGDRDAYKAGLMTKDPCCYPSSQGQQVIAQLLLSTGTDSLPGKAP